MSGRLDRAAEAATTARNRFVRVFVYAQVALFCVGILLPALLRAIGSL